MDRLSEIKRRLTEQFDPLYIEVLDESHKHVGHPGAQSGKGHFAIRICANQLLDKPKLEQHRLIYQALGELMQTDIHALKITILTHNPT